MKAQLISTDCYYCHTFEDPPLAFQSSSWSHHKGDVKIKLKDTTQKKINRSEKPTNFASTSANSSTSLPMKSVTIKHTERIHADENWCLLEKVQQENVRET